MPNVKQPDPTVKSAAPATFWTLPKYPGGRVLAKQVGYHRVDGRNVGLMLLINNEVHEFSYAQLEQYGAAVAEMELENV